MQEIDAPVPEEASWPFIQESPVLKDAPQSGHAVSIMLVNMCGLDWEDIERLLPVARQGANKQKMVPVLVVDLADVVPLRNAGLAYDMLPNIPANATLLPDLDWNAYAARRRALLIEKWRPEAIVHLGSDRNW
ncbi:hypothetical protein FMN50_11695 [Rhodobacterales bacterium]|nr:hypothetical protein FMN50_11695 [Rhodobacterales bacterium]